MRKKLLLLLLIPLFAFGYWVADWQNVGNVMQRSPDGFNYRISLGSNAPGYFYSYQKSQVDSLFLNVPNQSLADSSLKALNWMGMKQYSASLTKYFSPLYFAHTGAFGDAITVINSDSLAHHAPAYYLTYGNLTGAPTNVSSFTNDVPYATVSQVKATFNGAFFGQTASLANAGSYANSGDNTFVVSAWLNLLSVTSDSVKVNLTWTDGHSVTKTKVFKAVGTSSTGNMGTVDDYAFFSVCVRAKDATNLIVSTTVSGAGSILYEVGSVIEKKVGNGGL
jgi:hypothetical protein